MECRFKSDYGYRTGSILLNLTELGVEVLIKKNKYKNVNAFWDNYSLVVWQKDDSGFTSSKGMFKGNWGLAEKFSVDH